MWMREPVLPMSDQKRLRQWAPRMPALARLTTVAAAIAGAASAGPLAPWGVGRAAALDLAEPPVEIYSRIARGALACWFGTHGSLKKSHVFHADVAASEESGAEIVIHERDEAAQNPRSFRAFRVTIARSGSGSTVSAENLRFPAYVGRDLDADVRRWAAGRTGCSVVGAGGWEATPRRDEPAKSPPEKKKAR